MHHDIKKYFESLGEVDCRDASAATPSDAVRRSENNWYETIALTSPSGLWYYYINDKWYHEKKALKIVKLVAFL